MSSSSRRRVSRAGTLERIVEDLKVKYKDRAVFEDAHYGTLLALMPKSIKQIMNGDVSFPRRIHIPGSDVVVYAGEDVPTR